MPKTTLRERLEKEIYAFNYTQMSWRSKGVVYDFDSHEKLIDLIELEVAQAREETREELRDKMQRELIAAFRKVVYQAIQEYQENILKIKPHLRADIESAVAQMNQNQFLNKE